VDFVRLIGVRPSSSVPAHVPFGSPRVKRQITILNLIQWLVVGNCNLSKNSNSFKVSFVLGDVVPEHAPQTFETFEAVVDSLVTGSAIILELLDGI